MRISLLLEREPFGEILVRTLERFLPNVTGRPHEVTWYPRNPGVRTLVRRGQQPWLCNTYLNAIFAPDVEPQTLAPVLQEFSRSTVWWRRAAQRAYVGLAVSSHTAPVLAQAAVGIAPGVPDAEQRLIVGGNHKIRLLDRPRGVAYGLLKHGWDGRVMAREIRARLIAEAAGVPVPGVVSVADDRTWFAEAYVSGTPVNRLADRRLAAGAVREAWQSVAALHRRTRRDVTVGRYAAWLRTRIEQRLRAARGLDADVVARCRECVEAAARRLARHGDERIATALAHGDLQPANVIWDGRRVWVIDWEYAARRQAGYDALVYDLAARFPEGLTDRLRRFVATGAITLEPVPEEWRHADGRQRAAALFVVEELALRLDDWSLRPGAGVDPALSLVTREASDWLRADRMAA